MSNPSGISDIFYIGHRLSYENSLCTVRYIGEVANQKGVWIGVEWDEALRGKHNGAHQGIGWSENPSAASFLRPTRPFDPPRSFLAALRQKYVSGKDVVGSNDEGERVPDSVIYISGKQAEEVGFEKIRQQQANLKELRVAVLDNLCIAKSGEEDSDFNAVCPRVTELDLSRNLFEELREVLDICGQLPLLSRLVLNGNRFQRLQHNALDCVIPFTSLTSLSLDDTLMPWTDVAKIVFHLPSLKTFSACGNEYKNLGDDPIQTDLTTVSLERNNFTSLSDLWQLSQLSSLQTLSLKFNSIANISTTDGNLTFHNTITSIDLSYNAISTWTILDSLQQIFPGLTTLVTTSNLLYTTLLSPTGQPLTKEDGYLLTIARVAGITSLNYSVVSPKDRANAETYYLSLIAKELAVAPERDAALVLAWHPRYAELCREYGEPIVRRGAKGAVGDGALAERLVRLGLKLGDGIGDADGDGRSIEMHVPRSFSIYRLQSLVGQRLALKPMLLQLVWETGEEEVVADIRAELEDSAGADAGSFEPRVRLREEVLKPRTRSVGTWIDGTSAVVRVEWDEEAVRRHDAAKEALALQAGPERDQVIQSYLKSERTDFSKLAHS